MLTEAWRNVCNAEQSDNCVARQMADVKLQQSRSSERDNYIERSLIKSKCVRGGDRKRRRENLPFWLVFALVEFENSRPLVRLTGTQDSVGVLVEAVAPRLAAVMKGSVWGGSVAGDYIWIRQSPRSQSLKEEEYSIAYRKWIRDIRWTTQSRPRPTLIVSINPTPTALHSALRNQHEASKCFPNGDWP
jgi:hypothetical protein